MRLTSAPIAIAAVLALGAAAFFGPTQAEAAPGPTHVSGSNAATLAAAEAVAATIPNTTTSTSTSTSAPTTTTATPAATSQNAAAQLAATARAITDPASPQYRHFLTAAQAAALLPLPPSQSTAATAPTQLTHPSAPLGAHSTSVHLMYSQRISALDAARRLGISSAPTPIPTSAPAPTSTSTTGPLIPQPCSDYYNQLRTTTLPPGFGNRLPYAVCGYTPAQLRSAYGVDGVNGVDELGGSSDVGTGAGAGVTVAVLDAYASPTMLADADTYAAGHGDPAFKPGQYTEHVKPSSWNSQSVCGGTASWAGEESLDVEAVHAMAPRADILYYGANSCQDSDLLAALTDIVTHRLADVITDSWGGPLHSPSGDEPAATVTRYDQIFQLAAVEGITVDFSTGDCGANDPATTCGGASGEGSSRPQTTFPASDPWVTAVGGTSLAIGQDGEADWQSAWGTRAWALNGAGTGWSPLGWVFGGGGGASADFAQPWYQAPVVPLPLSDTLLTGASASSPRRTVPDVSLDADPFTGMLVGQTQPLPGGTTGYAESSIGGTSLASPLLAGIEADAISAAHGRPLGFVNPALYYLAGTRALTDVTATPLGTDRAPAEVFPASDGVSTVLAQLGDDRQLTAATGYDLATGLGSPADCFVEDLARP
jgi:subtilase family serine protease